jgi:hypothetical protein
MMITPKNVESIAWSLRLPGPIAARSDRLGFYRSSIFLNLGTSRCMISHAIK